MKKEFFYLVSGYLIFLTSIPSIIGAVIFLVFSFFFGNLHNDQAFGSSSTLLIGTIVFFFVYSTRFWKQGQKPKQLRDIDNEIEIIKKQIEKNKLLLKYNSIRKK